MMVHGLTRQRRWWLGIACAVLAAASVLGWLSTRGRNAWNTNGDPLPMYIAFHQGRTIFLSTLWRPGSEGRFAWQAANWMYDSLGHPPSDWKVEYRYMGDCYSGAPSYTALLHGVLIPTWLPAVPLALASFFLIRRARREALVGACPSCGYALDGLRAGACCPECGKPKTAPTS